ncbi:MAG: transglycosylase family protein [Nitriliruptorales bacterium]|nr:transglycosylase family protein [Nitriliruptorales bacterium]
MAAVGVASAVSLAVTAVAADDAEDTNQTPTAAPETTVSAAPTPATKAATYRAASLPIGAAPLPDEVDPTDAPNIAVEHDRIVEARREAEAARAHAAWHAEQERQAEQQAAASAPAQPSGSVWDRLAQCESNGDWDYNGSSGFDGGLQFHPDTWTAYKPADYPAYAYQATRAQQILVAERVLAAQGWGAWPACSAKLGLR